MSTRNRRESGGPGRAGRAGTFIAASAFALLVSLSAGTLWAAGAGSALPGGETAQVTPREQERRGPLPSVDRTIIPPPVPLPPPAVPDARGAVNPRTGERYLPSGKGVINPRTGEYYPPSGSGYINPRTGEYFPRVD
ncbi:MAG: hypothetical protein ACYC7J_14500 [Syntrophales bacterium]